MAFITLGEWLAHREFLSPYKVGLIDEETESHFTYRTLNLRARALAAYLQQQYHLRQGERVAVVAFNAPEYLDAFFACALLGAILVPLNWRLTAHELGSILNDCQPALLLYDSAHAELARSLQRTGQVRSLLTFDDFPGEQADLSSQIHPFTSVDGEEIALILYTSGTTGLPKGVLLSHRMITWNAINTQISWGLRDTDIVPTFAPFFHASGLNVLTTPLYHLGGTVVLLRGSSSQAIMSVIERRRCTVVFAVPTVFQQMLQHPTFTGSDFSSVRFFITGGSPCPPHVITGYAERGLGFRQGYGLTEVGVNCFSLAPEYAVSKAGSVGHPVFHSRARIVDEFDHDVPPGEIGELILAGPHVCSGYWQQPEATASVYRDGWWHTRDLVRQDADGFYYIVGRQKDMFISGGENIYPAEVENVIITHPEVLEVAIIPQPDARWGEVGLAVIVPRVPGSVTPEEILSFCAEKLARYKLPRAIRFVEALPRNAMGKIMKVELVKEFQVT
ncbi:class I adenylate-forming enzyme family protein [Dictyobacter aurantiacus]|uniref:Long-chain-fatty-acid--CoA ligase n=1 Tax=Dictyobacter aurantiacus TaxID=1936993 RepID=A0A401ZSS4_9CHLR|nr:long-chain fatty acid--CoA ligase [Dictyobacter aurantiacus]GCE09911.1 long-chain-fatty-acid--CoA ligase [Dictyobacter aurantiacus]